jgi:hypothetical protein
MSSLADSFDEGMISIQAASDTGHWGRAPSPEESAGYEAVRDSWVDSPMNVERLRTDPPALPASIREVPAERGPEDAEFAERMLERLAAADYAGALLAAEALLRRLPRDADALDCAEMSRTELRKVYVARLGPLDGVPSIAMGAAEIAALVPDVFTGVLLSRIDGLTSLQEIVFGRGMSPDPALRGLSELYLHGAITIQRGR